MVKDKPEGFAGLSFQEAQARLKKYGPNEFEQKQALSLPKLLLNQFTSPLIYILFFAGIVTLFLSEWTDAVVIFMAVLVNVILGFTQEFKAEKALEALKNILVSKTNVLRDGEKVLVETKNLVPGDVVILKTGDKMPADGICIEAVDLYVNEAVLTGESAPIAKTGKNEVFMGTVVVSGRGKMLIQQTGKGTKMGRIATKLSQTAGEETPLKKQIGQFSKTLAIIFSLICILIFFEGLWRGKEFLEIFTLSVAVAVAAIPEGLVISLTVILTLGMQRILKRKGLVRKLLAAETLGSVDIICSDKTGTLTEGRMRVVDASFTDKKAGIRATVLCNNMTNPLEVSMMNWAKDQDKGVEEMLNRAKRIGEIPFSSERKFIAVLVQEPQSTRAQTFLSGAPEMILEMVQASPEAKNKWRDELDKYTKKGLRVVAFAWADESLNKAKKEFEQLKTQAKKYDGKLKGSWEYLDLQWLGLLLFEDPPRKEVKESLRLCRQAGIEVKVITGDYRNTALAILKKLDLIGEKVGEEQVLEGWQLEKISQEELISRIDKVKLFCRTTPEQKIRIVEALQTKGHTVAMMGDGVNDALALRKSDIGVVVGEASEVAKETADMVLLDSNFNTIVAAVEEGRGIFENIRKVILYLLSSSFTETILISGSLLLGLSLPVTAVQILWVNLVQDGLPGLALAFEPIEKSLMQKPPRKKTQAILDLELKVLIFIVGLLTDLLLLTIFIFITKINIDLQMAQTIVFATLGINSLFYIFSCKSLQQNIWHTNLLNNKFLLLSVLLGFLFMLGALYLPFLQLFLGTVGLPFWILLAIFFLGIFNIILIEVVKWLFLKQEKTAILKIEL